MKKIIINIFLVTFCLTCFAQKNDTLILRSQKGLLFLSNYNYLYDKDQSEVKSSGVSDYFFPGESFNKVLFLDSTQSLNFKSGFKVEFFKERNELKSKAEKFNSSNTHCYFYDNFYVVEVIADYKLFDDDWPLDCRSEFFDLTVIKGSKLRFYHQRKAIIPTRITKLKALNTGK